MLLWLILDAVAAERALQLFRIFVTIHFYTGCATLSYAEQVSTWVSLSIADIAAHVTPAPQNRGSSAWAKLPNGWLRCSLAHPAGHVISASGAASQGYHIKSVSFTMYHISYIIYMRHTYRVCLRLALTDLRSSAGIN